MLDEANLAVLGRYYTERCDRSSISVMYSDAKSLPVRNSKGMCNCLGLYPVDQ